MTMKLIINRSGKQKISGPRELRQREIWIALCDGSRMEQGQGCTALLRASRLSRLKILAQERNVGRQAWNTIDPFQNRDDQFIGMGARFEDAIGQAIRRNERPLIAIDRAEEIWYRKRR